MKVGSPAVAARVRKLLALSVVLLAAILWFLLPGQSVSRVPPPEPRNVATATFAGGCFWCMEAPFESLPGVVSVTSGYTGGRLPNATYEQVSSGQTAHAESVQIVYDASRISYETLLNVYWHNVDPTTPHRQFCDEGTQYRSAIFYHDAAQKRLAEESKAAIERAGKVRPIVTQIVEAGAFYPAEEYHQHYYRKNPVRYRFYRLNCGRDARLRQLWGDAAGH
jgi:peptide-methionine (S)-S-oxide reductase